MATLTPSPLGGLDLGQMDGLEIGVEWCLTIDVLHRRSK
jgi:hypothetical protein